MALLTLVGNAYADQLTVTDIAINPGGTNKLSVALENPDYQYIMTEFWMSLPDGVSIAKDSNGNFIYEQSDRFDSTHSLVISKDAEGNVYHFLIYSSRNMPLTGNSGELFKVTLEAASDATTGTSQGLIYGQVFSDTDKQEHNPADVTFSVFVGELPKCATPTISITGGELEFSCDTEGVEFVSEVAVADAKTYDSNRVSLTGIYTVNVYATKEGYLNSDVATLEFSMEDGGLKGDVNKDSKVDIADVTAVINIINQ